MPSSIGRPFASFLKHTSFAARISRVDPLSGIREQPMPPVVHFQSPPSILFDTTITTFPTFAFLFPPAPAPAHTTLHTLSLNTGGPSFPSLALLFLHRSLCGPRSASFPLKKSRAGSVHIISRYRASPRPRRSWPRRLSLYSPRNLYPRQRLHASLFLNHTTSLCDLNQQEARRFWWASTQRDTQLSRTDGARNDHPQATACESW